MKDVKFRLWSPAHNKMIYGPTDDPNSSWILSIAPTLNQEPMMCLGIKDKNGKEVFEGDIVRCTEGCTHTIVWVQEMGGTYIGGMPGFNLSGLNMSGGKGYAWTGDEEIVGHIYDTPETRKICP